MSRFPRAAAISLVAVASPALAGVDAASDASGGALGSLLATWVPLVLIVVAWIWFMRRSGVSRHKLLQDRSLAHMARLEQQNERILVVLERIEHRLGERGERGSDAGFPDDRK